MCRQLSLPSPTEQYRSAEFGAGNGSFYDQQIDCDGHETSLDQCRQEPWNGHCGEENTVGVVCGDMVFAGNYVFLKNS